MTALKSRLVRRTLLLLAGWTIPAALPPVRAEQQLAVTDEFRVSEIGPELFFLKGKGGNILAVKGGDGLLIIDDELSEMSEPLMQELSALGGKDAVKYVVNTHWHFDHTGNNELLGGHAHIIAHDNVRKRLSASGEIAVLGKKLEPLTEKGLPELTYSERMTVHFAGREIQIKHFAGSHTDGDSVVFLPEANVLHTGDLYTNAVFPFVDLENGGDVVQYTETARALIDQIDDKTVVVPGHGELSNRRQMQAFYRMLVETTAEVRAMISAGLSKEEAQKKGLSAEWKSWGRGFIKEPMWVGIVYDSLTRSSPY